MATRILIADGHGLYLQGIASLLAGIPEYEVVASVRIGWEAVATTRQEQPDLVLLDVREPDVEALSTARRILEQSPATRILVLLEAPDRGSIARLIEAGARGYLGRDCSLEDLKAAIRQVADGRLHFGEGIREIVEDEYVRRLTRPAAAREGELTPREREIVGHIGGGTPTKAIALMLGISPKTVETHRRNLMRKLGVDSVAELTKYAIREGLTELGS